MMAGESLDVVTSEMLVSYSTSFLIFDSLQDIIEYRIENAE